MSEAVYKKQMDQIISDVPAIKAIQDPKTQCRIQQKNKTNPNTNKRQNSKLTTIVMKKRSYSYYSQLLHYILATRKTATSQMVYLQNSN
jgi:hypothetical protein